MSAVTKLTLCDRALASIGQPRLQSETGTRAETCFLLYDGLIEEVFSHPWTFVMRTVPLSRLTEAPERGWKYQFALPANRNGPPRALYDKPEFRFPSKQWDLQDDRVLSDHEQLWCEYPTLPQPRNWPGNVRKIMQLLLSGEFALSEREDARLRTLMFDEVYSTRGGQASMMQKAQQLDAQSKPSRTLDISSGPLVSVRHTG